MLRAPHRPEWTLVATALLASACVEEPKDVTDTDTLATDSEGDTDVPLEGTIIRPGTTTELPVGTPLRFVSDATEGEVSWDLGTGETLTGPDVPYTFDTPGNYFIVYTLRRPNGTTAREEVRLGVYVPPTNVAPRSAGDLVWTWDRQRLLLVVPEADHLVVVDPQMPETTFVPTCAEPVGVASRPGEVAVACGANALEVYDDITFAPLRTVALGDNVTPTSVVGDASGWVVSLEHGVVHRITGNDTETTTVGFGPSALALLPDGSWWAPRRRSPMTHSEVYREQGPTIELELDLEPDDHTRSRGVFSHIEQALPSPSGDRIYLAGTTVNNQRGLVRDGRRPQHDFSLRATIRVLDPTTSAEDTSLRTQFDDKGAISALVSTKHGTWLWALQPGIGAVARIDAFTLTEGQAITNLGLGTRGLALSEDDAVLYVHAWLDRTLIAYDTSDPTRTPTRLWELPTVEQEPLEPDILRGKKLFYDSKDPALSEAGYVRCHSCHPDGRQDGLVWDDTHRGEGYRNTTSLRGRAGMGHGPLHWTGNYDEIQDFEINIIEVQAGTGFLDDDRGDPSWRLPMLVDRAHRSVDLDALAAYLSTFDTFPPSPYAYEGDGEARFTAAGCGTCHDPSRDYTDSSLIDQVRHDVGTWSSTSGGMNYGPFEGFDTPTLRGLWATAPYLHDGSAATIADAIRRHDLGTEDQPLQDEDVEEIAAWLKSL